MMNYDYFQAGNSKLLMSLSVFKTYNELIEGENDNQNEDENDDANRDEDK